jgi:hypothetical protein
LRRDQDLPCGVRGPVDFEALRRLAAAFRGEVGLRSRLGGTSFLAT